MESSRSPTSKAVILFNSDYRIFIPARLRDKIKRTYFLDIYIFFDFF